MSKEEVVNLWKDKIAEEPQWALKAAIRIYQQQTPQEKRADMQLDSNGVGFNMVDAPVISPIVKKWLQHKDPSVLTAQEIYQLRVRMRKYAGQLYDLIASEEPEGT